MGNYSIILQGHGANQNGGDPKDADVIARLFAEALRAAGQQDVKGYFIYGFDYADEVVDSATGRGAHTIFEL